MCVVNKMNLCSSEFTSIGGCHGWQGFFGELPFFLLLRLKSTFKIPVFTAVKSSEIKWNQVKSSEFRKKIPNKFRRIREIHRNPPKKFPKNPPRYHPRSPVPLGSRSATQKSTKPMGSCWLTWVDKNHGKNGGFDGNFYGKIMDLLGLIQIFFRIYDEPLGFDDPYAPWCWYIYIQNWMFFRATVGKYSIHGANGMMHHGKNRRKMLSELEKMWDFMGCNYICLLLFLLIYAKWDFNLVPNS